MRDARGRRRRAARHPDPLLRAARLRRLHQDGRRGRRGRHRRRRKASRTRTTTATGSTADGLLDHRRPAPLRRRRRPRLRPRRARRSARATSPGQARQQEILVALRERVIARRQPALPAARAARRGRAARSARTCPVDRLPELAAIVDEVGRDDMIRRRHPVARWSSPKHPLRRLAGPRPRRDPGGRGGALHGTRHRAVPWPTPRPTPSRSRRRPRRRRPTARRPRLAPGTPSEAAGRHAADRTARGARSRSASTRDERRDASGATKPSATAWSSHAEQRVPVAGRGRAARSAWRAARAAPTTRPRPAPRACRARRAAR